MCDIFSITSSVLCVVCMLLTTHTQTTEHLSQVSTGDLHTEVNASDQINTPQYKVTMKIHTQLVSTITGSIACSQI